MELRKIYEYLRDNQYILSSGDDLVFSKKFYQDMGMKKEEKRPVLKVISSPPTTQQVVVKVENLPSKEVIDWRMKYMNFIAEARVPAKSDNGRGEMYDCNKYSEPAMKEFKRLIEVEKIIYDVLVKSTMLYYRASPNYRKKISNYIVDGDWRSDYLKLLNAAEQGEQAVKDHIKNETKDGRQHNSWSL